MATTTVILTAERRDGIGKGPARQMRMSGRIPAVIYGRGRDPAALSVSSSELDKLLSEHATASTVIELAVGGKPVSVLIREIQRHPVRRVITHVDFYEIRAGETITVDVPIVLDGVPSGVRNTGGTLDQVLREVSLEVLPRHLPERISLDVDHLEIGGSLHVSDLEIENAGILTDPTKTICTVIAPRVEEEPETTEAAAEPEEEEEGAEPELIRKPKAEDEGEDAGDAG
ncbi:MAG: 50S ribosomal protein L25/general stress protein Ctc [Gemmatimonadetes bacterium]|nr:50S ribosomal protein L25/general stress protein Ctc [Gemmatimonadota bacterium]